MPRPRHKSKVMIRLSSHHSRLPLCFDLKLVGVLFVIGLLETRLKLQLRDAIYRLRFYSNSLIHILSLSNSHNNVKNRGEKSHSVIVAIRMIFSALCKFVAETITFPKVFKIFTRELSRALTPFLVGSFVLSLHWGDRIPPPLVRLFSSIQA